MNTAYLLFGGNVGDRMFYLSNALSHVENTIGMVTKKSSVYETEAWGNENLQPFLNQLAVVETFFSPEELLDEALKTECLLGRERKGEKWRERTIDIDILFFNDMIVEKEYLHIPHPYFHERNFALIPMNEIAPEIIHPLLKKNMRQLLIECKDNRKVIIYKCNL